MHLLDGNVLIALTVSGHIHHAAAQRWLATDRPFATCPSTQGTLVRMLMRQETAVSRAVAVLQSITSRTGHEFWPDDASYADVDLTGVIGHRQVTDAYLADQARRHGARLATFDRGLAALHGDVVELVPI